MRGVSETTKGWGEMRENNFVSGGRNPNWERTCFDCLFLDKGKDRSGGWCQHPANRVSPMPGWPDGFTPSVSDTGGCDLQRRAGEQAQRQCNACDWTGPETDCVHPKHAQDMILCPACNEMTEVYP